MLKEVSITYSVEQAAHNLAVATVKYHLARLEQANMDPSNPEWDAMNQKVRDQYEHMVMLQNFFNEYAVKNAELLV